jgi:putative endopeptidase
MHVLGRALAVGLATGLVLAGCASAPTDAQQPPKPKYGTWGIDVTTMDKGVKPGDDFFSYVLGSWTKTAQIPPDKTCTGIDLDIQNQLDVDLKSVVESASAEHAPKGDISQKIGDLYSSFMDEKSLDARGIDPVKPFLATIDAAVDRAGMTAAMLSFNRMRTSVGDPFPAGMTIDPNDPTRYILGIDQGGLSLGERDYYLKGDPESVALREKFVAHVERMLGLAGYPDAHAQAESVLALETALAQVQRTQEESRDVEKSNNIMTRAEVEKLGAGAPLEEMFDALGFPAEIDVQVGAPDVLTKTAQLFATEPVESWKAYQRYQVLSAYGGVLSKPFSDELFDFYARTLAGQPERSPRDERGVSFVNGNFGEALGERYVERHFTQQTKDEALALVANLRRAYAARIDGAEWMTEQTKEQAQEKLTAMVAKIGYPDKWESYEGVDIVPDDLFANTRSLEVWASNDSLSKLGKPVDRSEWGMTPQTDNAYYTPQFNEFVFPAAILQPPYFDPAADPAANYGAIGATIGHEMSHAFDDQGRKSDATGKLRDWWTPADAQRYQQEADKLVAQFNSYEPLPGMHIDGAVTVGENIADLAGLRIAYDAYKLSLDGEEAPIIDGLTGDQRFFLAYAASWKKQCRNEIQRILLQSDVHSPEKYRVNGIVRNMDEWYTAFDVKEGDALYLRPQDRIKVW